MVGSALSAWTKYLYDTAEDLNLSFGLCQIRQMSLLFTSLNVFLNAFTVHKWKRITEQVVFKTSHIS